jgi:hypothetical protein
MVFFSMFHNINSTNETLPTSAGYDNSYNVGNVQPLHETRSETKIPTVDGVDEHHVVEAHLDNLWKQILAWKPNYCNSITWAFFEVNDNQLINLSEN